MRFKAVLFDFDGTLIDSTRLIIESYHHTMRIHRGTTLPDSEWIAGLGTPLRVQFRRFTDDPAEVQRMIETYREWNLAHHDEMVRAFPGAVDAVTGLKAKGAQLGIVTSKNRHGVERGLTLCGFDGLFDEIVTSDDLEASKPDPAPVLAALARLDVPALSALFVGDSPHDIAAGRDAGTRTAACLWGPFERDTLAAERPDYWLNSFRELVPLVT
ncbi:MAG TPA: HAD-IA family hydrolase [Gemmatimonadales bacterium]|nr:HAD-IA family hydrolase [Gemmatimonadales bacterium]